MRNVINTGNTEISILDRAIKGRNRRYRDGKSRRPVTDSLIEYAEELRNNLDIAARSAANAESEIEVMRDVIAKQSVAMEAMEAEIAVLKTSGAVETVEQPA